MAKSIERLRRKQRTKTAVMSSLFQHFSDTSVAWWLSLFPLTYLLHIADEYWSGDGYSAHVFKTYGIELSPSRFIVLQAIGFALMTSGVVLAIVFRFPNTLLVTFSGIVFVNSLVHIFRSLINGHAEPGLTTALLLWLPLGLITLVLVRNNMSFGRFCFAFLLGAMISSVVEMIAKTGGTFGVRRL
jgi:hypothetical protein